MVVGGGGGKGGGEGGEVKFLANWQRMQSDQTIFLEGARGGGG